MKSIRHFGEKSFGELAGELPLFQQSHNLLLLCLRQEANQLDLLHQQDRIVDFRVFHIVF